MITIPAIGSILTLTQDWTFDLWSVRRNEKFWLTVFGKPEEDPEMLLKHKLDQPPDKDPGYRWNNRLYRFWREGQGKKTLTLPVGTALKVARIQIRQNSKTDNSVTFTIVSCPASQLIGLRTKLKGRFVVKLADVNKIDADWDEATIDRK